jgi:putative ABC transport system permease protein
MIRNYILIALRNLKANTVFTSINIGGLTIGLTCCCLIVLYIQYELSFDNVHAKGSHIYRYIPRSSSDDGIVNMQRWTPAGLAPFLKEKFHEIKAVSRFTGWSKEPLLKFGGKQLVAGDLAAADSSFFEIFSFKLVQGDPTRILSRPLTMVMSKSMAELNFPGEEGVGKVIRYDNAFDLEVTGVFEDMPGNSHLQFSYLVSFLSIPEFMGQFDAVEKQEFLSGFGSWNYSTYIYAPNISPKDFERTLTEEVFFRINGRKLSPDRISDWLQPLKTIHFTLGIRRQQPDCG